MVSGVMSPTPSSDAVHGPIASLSGEECRVVLVELAVDGEVGAAAAALGLALLGDVDVAQVSDSVFERLSNMSHFEIGDRSGRRPGGGYVDPTQAASDLIEEAVEPWIADVERRARLGQVDAAADLVVGVVDGLRRCVPPRVETVLDWVPDALQEVANQLVQRAEACDVVIRVDELNRISPDWF